MPSLHIRLSCPRSLFPVYFLSISCLFPVYLFISPIDTQCFMEQVLQSSVRSVIPFYLFSVQNTRMCPPPSACVPQCLVLSQVTIFQVSTSQMCNFPSGNFPKVRLGPLRRNMLQWGTGRVLWLEQEVATWEKSFGKVARFR